MNQLELIGIGFLDLDAETSISLEFISPFFRESILQKGYSYPISLPATDENKKKLGFITQLDSTQDFGSYPCNHYYKGILIVTGTLKISSLNNTRISTYILEYEFDSSLLEGSLKEIDLGGNRDLGLSLATGPNMRDHAKDSITGTVDTWDYVFAPVYNANFYDKKTSLTHSPPHTYSGVVNLWDFDAGEFWNIPSPTDILSGPQDTDYTSPDTTPCASTFVPYPYLVYVIKRIAKHLGLTLHSTWTSDEAVKKLVIYNTFSLDKVEFYFTATLGSISVDFYINSCNNDINLSNHVPSISIAEFLDGLMNMYNLYIAIDAKNKRLIIEPFTKLHSLSDEIDLSDKVLRDYEIQQPDDNDVDGFSLKLGIDDNDKLHDFTAEKEIPSQLLEDGALQVSDPVGVIRFSPTLNQDRIKIFTSGLNRGTDVSYNPIFKTGLGKHEFESIIGTLKMACNLTIHYAQKVNPSSVSTLYDFLSGVIAWADQLGNSNQYGLFDNDFSFRIMSFSMSANGDPNALSGNYPIITSSKYDDTGTSLFTYPIKWIGTEDSLYPLWWQAWLQVLKGKKTTFQFLFTMSDILSLDLSKKIRIGNRLYYIKNLQLSFNNKGISLAKAECVQIVV